MNKTRMDTAGKISKPNKYLLISAILFIVLWLMIGISRDDEFADHSILVKYRPTFQIYFASPLGMDDRPADYPSELDTEEQLYNRFVRQQHWSNHPGVVLLAEIAIIAFVVVTTVGMLKTSCSTNGRKN